MNTNLITDIQKNGLDLVFKYIKKTNPFVVSYRISKDNKETNHDEDEKLSQN